MQKEPKAVLRYCQTLNWVKDSCLERDNLFWKYLVSCFFHSATVQKIIICGYMTCVGFLDFNESNRLYLKLDNYWQIDVLKSYWCPNQCSKKWKPWKWTHSLLYFLWLLLFFHQQMIQMEEASSWKVIIHTLISGFVKEL